MAKSTKGKQSTPRTLHHPTLGPCRAEPAYLAIHWVPGTPEATRKHLMQDAGVEPATLGGKDEDGPLRVNQTDALTWARGIGGSAPDTAGIDRLRAHEAVRWVGRGYRALQGDEGEAAVFTVNPTRIYVREASLTRAGGVPALGAEVSEDRTRPGHLRGYLALQVRAPESDALQLSQSLGKTLDAAGGQASDVRLETIPFISPACQMPRCEPPVSDFVPDDPYFPDQWGLQRIAVPRAWEMVRGSEEITVAVIDEGVQLDHPDLLLHPRSWNASDDTPDGSPTGNHGTACAGIIGARMDNGLGVAGVAGGVRVMAIATSTWADVDIAEGLYFAADHGARVVSMSFGVYPSWGTWDFDLVRDALQYARDRGLVLVAASGNENGAQSRFPGSDARTLCVGGSNRSDERKRIGDDSSEAWWGASYGPDLDVVAPCLEIPTTDRLGGLGYSPGDYYERFNGTSAATPHVAGVAALLLSLNPGLTPGQVRTLIEQSCDKISPALYPYAHVASKPSGTWHAEVGYGRVNVERALLAACALDRREAGECRGCGGECIDPVPEPCRGPRPVPWLPHDRCQYFYEGRIFNLAGPVQSVQNVRPLQVRVVYQHCLRLKGRQQGPLLYTTTLLPGEEVRLYEFDRYRRVRSSREQVTVHASFRQTLSALSQTRQSRDASAYVNVLNEVRVHADTSVSAGGGLAGFFGAPKASGSLEQELASTVASGSSVRTVSEQFSQLAITASQAIEAERSLVVSRYEEQEHQATTARMLRNANRCHAVTYYVRRVNEVYEALTRVESVEWRPGGEGSWRDIEDRDDLSEEWLKWLEWARGRLPRPGDQVNDPRPVTLPTDGTVYETELAHCSACEPVRAAEETMHLEQLRLETRRTCLELELMALEVERRRGLVTRDPDRFEAWPLTGGDTAPAGTETGVIPAGEDPTV